MGRLSPGETLVGNSGFFSENLAIDIGAKYKHRGSCSVICAQTIVLCDSPAKFRESHPNHSVLYSQQFQIILKGLYGF